jgi:CheY-like chemotaxis protein
VALMGGSIDVESEPWRGSMFTFTARFGRRGADRAPMTARAPSLLLGLPVLIVDDNVTNRQILQEWLDAWNMEPTAVADAAAAAESLEQAVAWGRPFPLVLLDNCMPDTSELTLAAIIRGRPELAATRIILLTSGEHADDGARARALRIEARLLKPVPQSELYETIARVMDLPDGHRAAVAPAALPAPRASRPLRVLVAEDNEFNTRHIDRLLTRQGHSVRLAMDGSEALAILGIVPAEAVASGERRPSPTGASSAEGAEFDVLLLDLQMPELDGFLVARSIREREAVAGGHLPIIALTARSRREDRERCLTVGMDDYLSKPVQTTELLAAIDRVTGGGSHTASAVVESLLDPVVLLAASGDDAEILRVLCCDFTTYAPARLAEVRDAADAGDAPRLREAAHRLRGLISAFSTTAGTVAAGLENAAAEGRLGDTGELVDRLDAMTRDLIRHAEGMAIEDLRLLAKRQSARQA